MTFTWNYHNILRHHSSKANGSDNSPCVKRKDFSSTVSMYCLDVPSSQHRASCDKPGTWWQRCHPRHTVRFISQLPGSSDSLVEFEWRNMVIENIQHLSFVHSIGLPGTCRQQRR